MRAWHATPGLVERVREHSRRRPPDPRIAKLARYVALRRAALEASSARPSVIVAQEYILKDIQKILDEDR